MDGVHIVTVRCERRYLWRTVDQDGDVLDSLVQNHTDKRAAMSFFKKLMKGQCRSARLIVTDKLPSYGAARKVIMATLMHCHERYANNRAEYLMSIREPRSGRCDDSSHLARHNVPRPFTVRSTISFASVDICFGLQTIGC